MHAKELSARRLVNLARTQIEEHRYSLALRHDIVTGRGHRIEELQEILSLLEEVSAHIDPHDEEPWLNQSPLPL